jgi:hypothetical protein
MERTVLEESWGRDGPVGPSLEVTDDDDDDLIYYFHFNTWQHFHPLLVF